MVNIQKIDLAAVQKPTTFKGNTETKEPDTIQSNVINNGPECDTVSFNGPLTGTR